MTKAKRLLAIGAAAAMVPGLASAQLQGNPIDFSSNWHTNRVTGTAAVGFSGSLLFGVLAPAGTTHPGFGDSVRRCYGIDNTQGGRNQSAGIVNTTWFAVGQGYGPNNTAAFSVVDLGVTSIVSYVDSDVNQDICLNPFADQIVGAGTGAQAVNAAAVIGQVAGTAGMAFPTVWEIVFQWVGSGSLDNGPDSPFTVGTFPDTNSRLPNLVYEVQGPLNGGPGNEQYYLAATTEAPGSTANSIGGVANGNNMFGYSLFGSTADAAFTQMGTRFTAFDNVGGYLTVATNGIFTTPTTLEFFGRVATQTPALWASRDGVNDGIGGTDWVASSAPTSNVNLRFLDCFGGAEGTAQIGSHKGGVTAGGGTPGPTSVFNPFLVLNVGFFLWSASSAATHPQNPSSWDDLGGLLTPAVPGSFVLGPQATSREGPQTVPIIFDGLTAAILGVSTLSVGTSLTPSDDIFEGTYFTTGGALANAVFEGSFDPIVSGISGLTGGPVPIFAAPSPTLRGAQLCVAAAGVQFTAGPGPPALNVTEFANGVTLNLQ